MLIKTLRKEFPKLTLGDIVQSLYNLPYSIGEIDAYHAENIKKEIEKFSVVKLEKDALESVDNCEVFNINIELSKEYTVALAWYDELQDFEKSYVNTIVEWRNRPAVC